MPSQPQLHPSRARLARRAVIVTALALFPAQAAAPARGDSAELPHGQSVKPGPALSPQEAVDRMKLPPGFKAEVVASEPELINPTSMTFDDRGRIWVTESVEYPRASAGKGQDRVKILESTKHDGHYDKVTVFKDGLNIPAGVAIGNGGVYVTNSPDVLFLQDTSGTGHADKEEVILTGFGRDDRHELPNSLTWGPDGWLYGMNGVFNRSSVKDPATGKVIDFTCAIWRYHPKTKKFELFAEGTSNPWGLDYNRQGDWFVSCCVIDHLFHMTQSGYYTRQGGPYPPLTQILPSITTTHHEQAAYAGLCIYDADALPPEYRGRFIMGNLHGSCLNQDVLTRNGATYTQHSVTEEPGDPDARTNRADGKGGIDFLHANDAWYMPVSTKIGPDGCLYVMDWYDRYHCYQDANRDAPGLDRTRGRIYRISYHDTPVFKPFDLQQESTEALLKLLDHPNVWWRRTAQRILSEKFDPSLVPALEKMALDAPHENNGHLHALWLLVGRHALEESFHLKVLSSENAPTRNWGVRGAGEMGRASPAIFDKLKSMAADPSPDVRAQLAVAAGRLTDASGSPAGLPILEAMLQTPDSAKDPLIPTLIYNNLRPLAATRGKEILEFARTDEQARAFYGGTVLRWITAYVNAATGRSAADVVADLRKALSADPNPEQARAALQTALDALTHSGLSGSDRVNAFSPQKDRPAIGRWASEPSVARIPALTMAVWWRDLKAVEAARRIVADPKADAAVRVGLLRALSESGVTGNRESFAALATDAGAPVLLRQAAVEALGEAEDPAAARILTDDYAAMPADLRPMAVNALTHSKAGASALLDAIEQKKLAAGDVNANHVRQIQSLNDANLSRRVAAAWGQVKTERDPERVRVVARMKKLVESRPPGDAYAGRQVFNKTCAQCHSIYGSRQGAVGPDLTGVGRENLDAVLTNVLDPSLVIGAPYLVYVARTKGGDTYSGILVEKSDRQVVLKDQTRQMIIPADDLEKLTVQNISMMPEGLEKSMSEQEFVDLVAFLLTREAPPEKAGGVQKGAAAGQNEK